MISKSLTMTLLRIVQSPEGESFSASGALRAFVDEHGVGFLKGSKVIVTEAQKERIRALLQAQNISPTTPPDAWHGLGRSEALAIGPDEKWAKEAVRARRIAFKALAGRPLYLDGQALYLPRGANLEWSVEDAISALTQPCVVVVENWEAFEKIDDLAIDMSRAGENPLILWRGGGQHTSVGATMEFLDRFRRPVWSAPDYDPEGLAIAARLPNLAGVLAPAPHVLNRLLTESSLRERYLQQLPGASSALEQATHPDVIAIWRMVREVGLALPQEELLREKHRCGVEEAKTMP